MQSTLRMHATPLITERPYCCLVGVLAVVDCLGNCEGFPRVPNVDWPCLSVLYGASIVWNVQPEFCV